MSRTIYISIASNDDIEILKTVENAISSADNSENIFIGISLLDKSNKIFKKIDRAYKDNKNVSYEYINLNKNSISEMGTGKGRHRALQMYSDQDFVLQIDSHTMFLDGWDTLLLSLFDEFKSIYENDKFVLTGYLPRYTYNKYGNRISIRTKLFYPFFVPEEFYLNKIPKWETVDVDMSSYGKFIPSVKFNGGFAFGGKEFINNTGLYKDSIFYDEEMIQSINLIASDMALVFANINNFPLHHLYTDDVNEYGGDREYFADMFGTEERKYFADKSVSNYLDYVNNPDNANIVKKYEKYARINVKKGAITDRYVPKNFTIKDIK